MKFSLDKILTITTDRLVAENGMADVYSTLNYLNGFDLFTHQLPAAAKRCTPIILAKYPELAPVSEPKNTALLSTLLDDCKKGGIDPYCGVAEWLKMMKSQYNLLDEYDLSPIGELE